MLQSLATLVFSAAAVSALFVIAALIAAEWQSVRLALGLVHLAPDDTLPPRIRALPARRVPMLRVTPEALLRAA